MHNAHNIITDHVPSDHYWTKCWLDFPSYLKPSIVLPTSTFPTMSNTSGWVDQHLASSDHENLRGRTPHGKCHMFCKKIRPYMALLLYLVILGHEPTSSLNNPSIRPDPLKSRGFPSLDLFSNVGTLKLFTASFPH